MGKNRTIHALLVSLIALAAVVFLLFSFVALVNDTRDRYSDSGIETLYLSLRRAAASCYATEGAYPPDLDYLCRRYGVVIDSDRYIVFYDAFAENLMPDITVIEREK